MVVNSTVLPLQATVSQSITAIQIIASALTIILAGIQLYDYLSVSDIYNRAPDLGSTDGTTSPLFGSESPPNERAPIWETLSQREEVRYLTISLFSFVALSTVSIVDSLVGLYVSAVFIGIVLISEYSRNAANTSWWSRMSFITKLVFGNLFFLFVLLVAAFVAAGLSTTLDEGVLGVSFGFLPAAIWFGLASIARVAGAN